MNAAPSPPIESRLVRTLLAGEFALTAEIVPPVSASAEDLLAVAEPLRGLVDAVNVTDGPSAKVQMSALAGAAILAANGFQPVMQMTCRDRNRIGLVNDLLGASALGIRNLLLLRGDDPKAGTYPDATPVFEAEAVELIRWASDMSRNGVLPGSGHRITRGGIAPTVPLIRTRPRFFVGAADTPIDPPVDWLPEALEKKIKAGAQFVQTQLCYDIELVERYIARLRDLGLTDRVFILIGTGPLASARSARWMNENLWGVNVPDAVIGRLEKADDQKAEGSNLCAEFLQRLFELPGVAGVHLMAPGNATALPSVIREARQSQVAMQLA